MRPSSVTFVPTSLAFAAVCLFSATTARGQSQEEFELQGGRRFPAESVKPSPGGGFTATITVGTALQTFNFTAKEVTRASLREPKEISEARFLIASDKPDKAIESLDKVEPALVPFQSIPDSWWLRATILRMDALSVLGKNKEAAAVASADVFGKLTSENTSLLKDFQQVVAPAGKNLTEKLDTLHAMEDRIVDSWVGARIWLEIGNTLAMQGKMEDAVKAWLRVPVFFPAERDLAIRGTILGARGLQQIGRAPDGEKLLKDYLEDHLASPYKDTIQIETAKLKPKDPKTPPAAAPPEPTETTK
ncbi:MAG: hypothetical protein ABIT37_23410 [Luteolibacter sp.]